MYRFKCVEGLRDFMLGPVREGSYKVNASDVNTNMQKYFLVPHPLACFLSSPLIMHIIRCSTYFYPL